MSNLVSLSAGLLVGFAVAVPIGPMGLLCIQRPLASGMRTGVSTGLGAATVNVAYGAVILLGMDTMAPWMASGRRLYSALGGLFLLWSAGRTLMRRRVPQQATGSATFDQDLSRNPAPSPLAAYGSAVAFNATNPMAPMVIMALLSSQAGQSSPSLGDTGLLLFGMFGAATAWWICLSGGVSLLRTRLSPAMLGYVNQAAGLLLSLYGLLALARSARM